jgi:hypothetical protein
VRENKQISPKIPGSPPCPGKLKKGLLLSTLESHISDVHDGDSLIEMTKIKSICVALLQVLLLVVASLEDNTKILSIQGTPH